MSAIQKWACVYAGMFLLVVALDFIPAFQDENGYLWGIFTLDVYDNALHAFSGLWALVAGILSSKAALRYFQIFGALYFLDGVIGLFFGNAILDFGIFQYGIGNYGLIYNVLANLPHIFIGGIAVFLGYFWQRRF